MFSEKFSQAAQQQRSSSNYRQSQSTIFTDLLAKRQKAVLKTSSISHHNTISSSSTTTAAATPNTQFASTNLSIPSIINTTPLISTTASLQNQPDQSNLLNRRSLQKRQNSLHQIPVSQTSSSTTTTELQQQSSLTPLRSSQHLTRTPLTQSNASKQQSQTQISFPQSPNHKSTHMPATATGGSRRLDRVNSSSSQLLLTPIQFTADQSPFRRKVSAGTSEASAASRVARISRPEELLKQIQNALTSSIASANSNINTTTSTPIPSGTSSLQTSQNTTGQIPLSTGGAAASSMTSISTKQSSQSKEINSILETIMCLIDSAQTASKNESELYQLSRSITRKDRENQALSKEAKMQRVQNLQNQEDLHIYKFKCEGLTNALRELKQENHLLVQKNNQLRRQISSFEKRLQLLTEPQPQGQMQLQQQQQQSQQSLQQQQQQQLLQRQSTLQKMNSTGMNNSTNMGNANSPLPIAKPSSSFMSFKKEDLNSSSDQMLSSQKLSQQPLLPSSSNQANPQQSNNLLEWPSPVKKSQQQQQSQQYSRTAQSSPLFLSAPRCASFDARTDEQPEPFQTLQPQQVQEQQEYQQQKQQQQQQQQPTPVVKSSLKANMQVVLSDLVRENEGLKKQLRTREKEVERMKDVNYKLQDKINRLFKRIDIMKVKHAGGNANSSQNNQFAAAKKQPQVDDIYTFEDNILPRTIDCKMQTLPLKHQNFLTDLMDNTNSDWFLNSLEDEKKEQVELIVKQLTSFRDFAEKTNSMIGEVLYISDLQTIDSISSYISSCLSRHFQAETIHLWIKHADTGLIRTISKFGKEIMIIQEKGAISTCFDSRRVCNHSSTVGGGILGYITTQNESVYIEKSVLFPITSSHDASHIIGVLEISRIVTKDFAVDEQYLAILLSNCIRIAITNLLQTNVLNRQIKHANKNEEFFTELCRAPNRRIFCETISQHSSVIFTSKATRFVFVNPITQEITHFPVINTSKPTESELQTEKRFDSNQSSIVRRVIESQSPMIIMNSTKQTDFHDELDVPSLLPVYYFPILMKSISRDRSQSNQSNSLMNDPKIPEKKSFKYVSPFDVVGVVQITLRSKIYTKINTTGYTPSTGQLLIQDKGLLSTDIEFRIFCEYIKSAYSLLYSQSNS